MSELQCPRCRVTLYEGQSYCASCGLAVGTEAIAGVAAAAKREKRQRKARKAKRVDLAGHVIANAISGAVTAMLAIILAFIFFGNRDSGGLPPQISIVTPAPFESDSGDSAINASALVPLADSRFLVVDDLTDDAFFEMAFTPEGKKNGPLVRRPITGLSSEVVEDLEGATLVENGNRRYIAAISSLEANEGERTEDGFVRVTVGDEDELIGEVMPGFRAWLLSQYPELSEGPDGPAAIDVQGLTWDSERKHLAVGLKSATSTGRPLVMFLRVKDWDGPWTVENLEALPSMTLEMGDAGTAKGIYSIGIDPKSREYVLIIGDSSAKKGSFGLYGWDGGKGGKLRPLTNVAFDPRMKPEGIAYGTIGGRPATVVVDDHGGYYVLWQDAKGG